MKMKKFAGLVLATAMTASLFAGCGNSNNGSETGKSASDSNAGVEPTGDGPVWKIGAIGPLTGAGANYGNAVCDAAELAIKEINAAGGINGYQIAYKKEDDELDNEKSVNAYNALKDWGMQILVGPTTSDCTIAVSELTKADNVFQITPSGSAVECTKYDNVYRVCFADPAQGAKSAEYIGTHNLAKKVGIIYDSSTTYSSGIEQSFVEEAKNQGVEVVAAEAFTADTKTDFTAQLQKMKDSGAELVFLPIYYTEAATILTQASSMGLSVKWFGCDGLDGMLDMDNFDASLAEGVMLLTPFAADATDDLTTKFVSSYKEAYKVTPNQFAADSYDAVYALKAALEKADLKPDASVADITAALKANMTEIELAGLTGNIKWTADGEPDKNPKAVVIKNGTYVSME